MEKEKTKQLERLIKNLILFLTLICLISCTETNSVQKETIDLRSENQLENELVEIELEYYGMMCPCPQWATRENIELYEESLETENVIPMDSLFIRIEPNNKNTINPFDLDGKEDLTFKFVGRFYKKKKKWLTESGIVFNCKVLRYENCEIITQ